jgi:hypothetical protein
MKPIHRLFVVALAADVLTAAAAINSVQIDLGDPSTPLNAGGFATFQPNGQQLVLTATRAAPTDPDQLVASTGGVFPPTLFPSTVLPDQQTLELRADLVGANQDDAFADLHWSLNGRGYAFMKDQNELSLLKGWNNLATGAVFFWTNTPVKNQNVSLVLAFARRGADLQITTRVLDNDNTDAVLFERTVTDTPGSDPVLPDGAMKGLRSQPDPAGTPWLLQFEGYAAVGVGWINIDKAPDPLAEVTFGNLRVSQYESPQLTVQSAIRLSWAITQGQFVLESAPGSDGPWTLVPDPWLRTIDGRCEVSVLASDTVKFFRLRASD